MRPHHPHNSRQYDPSYWRQSGHGLGLMSDWGIDNSDYDSYDPGQAWERTTAFSQEDIEGSLMEKPLVAWQELIGNQEFYLRKDLQRTVGSATGSKDDLGSQFNEPQLNRKIRHPQSGEERSLFTVDLSEGNAKFSCSVCQIYVTGIKTLQSHILGKKHKNIVSGYKIIGE